MTAFTLPRRLALAALLALAAPPAFANGMGDTPSNGCARAVSLVNEAGRPVQELFLRPTGSAGWGADLLGEAVLRPGQSFALTPASGGPVDLMVMLADGTARALWRLNGCTARRVTLTAALALRAE